MLARGLIETSDVHVHGALKIRSSRYGFCLRGKTAHHGNNDPRSRAVGNAASRIAHAWRNVLTTGERNQWSIFASTNIARKHSGRLVTLNAFQAFSRINHTRITLGRTIKTTPPPSPLTYDAPLDLIELSNPGIALYRFTAGSAWMTDSRVTAVVCDAGPSTTIKHNKRTYGRILATHVGIPTGYPIPLAAIRPFATLGTGGTLFTYVAWTQA